MQEKLIEILSGAKGWMTAAQIADKGGWRSPANVGVALQQTEKANGSVVRRKSPTVKQGNGMPATEWRHVDKHFDGDHVPAVTKMIEAKPVIKESLTAEENLRQQVAHLTDQLAGEKSNIARIKALELDPNDGGAEPIISAIAALKSQLETAETAVIRWLDLAREYECKTIPELREFISALRLAKSENVALKTLNGEMPGFGALHQALTKRPFVVRCSGAPAVFAKKLDSAKAKALTLARHNTQAFEVFALLPVGKAVHGAEWKSA